MNYLLLCAEFWKEDSIAGSIPLILFRFCRIQHEICLGQIIGRQFYLEQDKISLGQIIERQQVSPAWNGINHLYLRQKWVITGISNV